MCLDFDIAVESDLDIFSEFNFQIDLGYKTLIVPGIWTLTLDLALTLISILIFAST